MRSLVMNVNKPASLYLILVGSLLLLQSGCSDSSKLERVLGEKLPPTARKVLVYQENIQDSKVVKVWATLKASLSDTSTFVKNLDMKIADTGNSVTFPTPTLILDWWPDEGHLAAMQYKWIEEGPDFKPAFFAIGWEKGKLYLFYYGLPNLKNYQNNLTAKVAHSS
jgi:hypothetical protein